MALPKLKIRANATATDAIALKNINSDSSEFKSALRFLCKSNQIERYRCKAQSKLMNAIENAMIYLFIGFIAGIVLGVWLKAQM